MKNQFQLLLEEIQKEYNFLEGEMNSCIENWDFLGAENYKKPLLLAKKKLTILKNIENPNYDRINIIKSKLQFYNNLEVKNEASKYIKEKSKERIRPLEDELIVLQNESQLTPKPFLDNDQISSCLDMIYYGAINQFEIELSKESLWIEIIGTSQSVDIKLITKGRKIIKQWSSDNKFSLRQLGFEINDTFAILRIRDHIRIQPSFIIEILSRLIFDIKSLYKIKNALLKY